jgi:ribosomal protein S27E
MQTSRVVMLTVLWRGRTRNRNGICIDSVPIELFPNELCASLVMRIATVPECDIKGVQLSWCGAVLPEMQVIESFSVNGWPLVFDDEKQPPELLLSLPVGSVLLDWSVRRLAEILPEKVIKHKCGVCFHKTVLFVNARGVKRIACPVCGDKREVDTEASEKEVSTRTALTPRHPGKLRSGFVGSVRVKRLGVRVACGGCGKNLFFVTRKTGEIKKSCRRCHGAIKFEVVPGGKNNIPVFLVQSVCAPCAHGFESPPLAISNF